MKNSTKSEKAVKNLNEKLYSSKSAKCSVLAIIFTSIIFMSSITSYSQTDNFEGMVGTFIQENGTKVIQPYADAVSSDLNSGLFHTAKVKKGFSIYFGIKGSGTYINPENSVVAGTNKTLDILPMAVPQIQVGSVFGTEFSLRYMPSISIGKYGSIQSWGFGMKHGITSHFKKAPVDVAVGFSMNKLAIDDSKEKDLVDASSIAANLQISKELSVFTFYTGLQYENTNMELNVKNDTNSSIMSFENGNKVRAILGLNIKLGPLNLNGDYNIGKTNSFSAGFGFAF
jgi:hypothetical protein